MNVGRRMGWGTCVSAARLEIVFCLVRATVLVFSGVSLALSQHAPRGVVGFHAAVAAVSVLLVIPLSHARSPERVRAFAVGSLVVDVLLYAGYCAAVTDELGLGSLYGVVVLLLGPLRGGLRGAVATGIPVGLIAVIWPVRDAIGSAPGPAEVVVLVLLLTLPAAGASAFWRRSGARLRQAQSLFEAAFEHASIGMALLDERLVVKQANHALAGLLAISVDRLAGSGFAGLVHVDDRVKVQDALLALPTSPHALRLEVRFASVDGKVAWGLLAASWLGGSNGVPGRIVAQVENVTDRKSAEEKLAHQALHDELTGLPNRTYLRVRLEHALAQGDLPCLLYLDLDRFKVVNDGLGHAAGDRLLVEVAERLRVVVRPGDLVARLGGDEFVVLAGRVDDEEQAVALGERVLAALRGPVQVAPGIEVVVSASGGLALADRHSTSDTLLRDADTAMYGAKDSGGKRLCVFTPDLHQQAKRTQELEVDLRRALAGGDLVMAYQPVVDLTTGRVVEAEALLRWHHPVRGEISPTEFVPLAEQSGLIEDIGRWALRCAVLEAVSWPPPAPGAVPAGVAVNVSLRQLQDPNFPGYVREVLAEAGLSPSRLCLEVTETALGADTAPVVPVLHQLREVGVRLAIDDFGTGHASLTYLAQFPVDVVKIDASFVAGVADDAGSAAIVGGVVAMAVAFGLSVVAEGVENATQLLALRRLGVDRAQGFLLARPMASRPLLEVMAAAAAVLPEPRVSDDSRPAPPIEQDVPVRLRLLLDAARDVTASVELGDVLRRSFQALRQVVAFTGGSIQLVDGNVVRLAATDPPATAEALQASIPLGQGISGTIALTGEPRYLPDITIVAAVTPRRRTANSSMGVRSWYGVPLVAEGRTIGVLQIDSTLVDAFTDADRLLVLSFASVVASAVQGTRLFNRGIGALQHPRLSS